MFLLLFISSPSLVIYYLRGVYIYPHSVVEVVYVGAVRRLCNVPEEKRP